MLKTALVISAASAFDLITSDTNSEGNIFTCFDYAETSLKVQTWTVYSEDEDKNYWRVMFDYTGKIQEDDIVYFYLSFTPTNLIASREVATIAEDIGYCRMANRSDDTIFWDATANDLYAKCTAADGDPTACEVSADPYISTVESSSENNWFIPIEDDNPDDEERFCTRPENYLEDQTYACDKLKCYIQRLFETGDTDKDLIISAPDNNSSPTTVTVA